MGHIDLFNKITNKQAVLGVIAVTVLVLASFVSTMVSAATLTERSITPSTQSVSAARGSVQYQVQFTPKVNAGAVVVEFCSNTPLIGQSCTAPTGMDVSDAASSGGVVVTDATLNKIVATKAMTADTPETIVLTDLTNPTSTGVTYARIVTYVDGTEAAKYVSDDPSADGIKPLDSGSVAMYFNDTVAVSGTVLETLTFCVSSAVINANCGNVAAPSIKLGEETAPGSGVFALVPGQISEGTLHTQINTNAASGAVVRLRSSAPCGGLMRAGSDKCDIEAAKDQDVNANDNSARFGVKTAAAATNAPGAQNPIGTLRPYDASLDPENPAPYYLSSRFSFNYDSANAMTVGVTSTFGDPFLDTANAPATGKNMALTFGASVSTNTPAGLYSTDLSMIAVGKF